MENRDRDDKRMDPSAGFDKKDGEGKKRAFGRRKVCPFVMDKSLVLDYKSLRVIQRFISETGKIVPRHVSGVSARSQRQLTKHVKRARNIGFIAAAMD